MAPLADPAARPALIEPFTDDAAIADEHRRHLHHGTLQQVEQLGKVLCRSRSCCTASCSLSASRRCNSGSWQSLPQPVRSRGRAERRASAPPPHIADLAQQAPQLIIEVLLDELLDGALATFEDHPIADRLVDQREQAAAHRRGGAIEHGGGYFRDRRPDSGSAQIAAGGGIHDDRMIGLFQAHAARCGAGGALGVFHVLHQAAGGAQGGLALLDPKPTRSWVLPNCWHKSLRAVPSSNSHSGRRRRPRRPSTYGAGRRTIRGRAAPPDGALQLRQQGLLFLELVDEEATGADVHGAVTKRRHRDWTAAIRLSCRSLSSASSETVPGVMMRMTLRSTGLAGGIPTCSQMAADSAELYPA